MKEPRYADEIKAPPQLRQHTMLPSVEHMRCYLVITAVPESKQDPVKQCTLIKRLQAKHVFENEDLRAIPQDVPDRSIQRGSRAIRFAPPRPGHREPNTWWSGCVKIKLMISEGLSCPRDRDLSRLSRVSAVHFLLEKWIRRYGPVIFKRTPHTGHGVLQYYVKY